jgi:serine/threonine protein phosphatase PrpC
LKTFEKIVSHSTRFRIGYADTIGRRPTMEDEIRIMGKLRGRDDEDFVAIFDGHGGRDVADFAAKNLHQVCFFTLFGS